KQFCNFKSLYVVPNALNNLNFSRRVKKINRDKTKLFFIGRLIETKGVAESIKALSILKDEGIENVILDIAGDGPFQEELKKISIELGVNNSCNFVGPIFDEQKNELWEASDILVFPTYFKEGLPYALLEALATGTPSITTAAGGIPEIIDDNIEGIIVEPKNALQVAEAIKYLIQNPDKYELMSIACLEKAQNKFSILNLANKIDNIYLSLL
ncbi:glycosyltransferase family 4 protein, partial [Methylicorpusculum sp.]|uniref:glycosyltransferase family 4 protein n=1 Tax=Methylicorpusculum sp. TaxID=2713644 RepID=UPI002ABBBCF9